MPENNPYSTNPSQVPGAASSSTPGGMGGAASPAPTGAPAGMGGPLGEASSNGSAGPMSGYGAAGLAALPMMPPPVMPPLAASGTGGPAGLATPPVIVAPAAPTGQPAQNWSATTASPSVSVNPAGGITISFQSNGLTWSVIVNCTR